MSFVCKMVIANTLLSDFFTFLSLFMLNQLTYCLSDTVQVHLLIIAKLISFLFAIYYSVNMIVDLSFTQPVLYAVRIVVVSNALLIK
jgi:hypothetical protein